VVPFVDVGTAGGMHYLAWPLVQGEPLDQLVQRQGKLSPPQAAQFALQVAEGLEVCQKQGLIHGFIKASNLMLGPDQQIRILDFGIGCLLAETEGESLVDTMSTANSVASGLDCASPESIMDPTNLTPAGDQYSLGCVLYFLLTGRYPFPEGSAAEKMMAHQLKEPEPVRVLNPDVPEKLVEVVNRLMQKKPEDRFASAAEAAEAVRPFAPLLPVAPKPLIRANQLRNQGLEPVRLPAAALVETPVPAAHAPAARPVAAAPVLPTRQTIRAEEMEEAEEDTPVAPVARPAPVRERFSLDPPERSAEERFGPLGIVLGAILACVLAWLMTWYLF
jgi:serine/threonine protein kinase